MELKFSSVINNEAGNKAEIRLFNNIGSGTNTGDQIAAEVDFLVNIAEVTEILVKINSGGGSMIEGFGIFSALMGAKEKGVNVNVRIEGMAASMAGIIAMVGNKISIVDFGILMLHNPHNGSNNVDEKQQSILDKFKASAITIINSKTGKNHEEISEMMNAETWLDASQALEMGFVDEIIQTGSKKETKKMQNAIMEIAMSYTNKKQNTYNMKNVINHLQLEEGATEEVILNHIKEMQNNLSVKDTELTAKEEVINALNAEKTELDNKVKEAYNKLSEAVLQGAIDSGKIKKDAKNSLLEAANGNFDLLQTLINSVESPKVKLMDFVNNASTEKVSFRQLEKSNPERLKQIKNNSPEEYKALYKAEYGVEPILN